ETATVDGDGCAIRCATRPEVRGQRHKPLLVPLPDNPQQPIGAVNGADFQAYGLADAQTTAIHEREARPVDRIPEGTQKGTDLEIRQDSRPPPLLRWTDPFSPQTAPSCAPASGDKATGCRRDWS